MVLGRGNLRRLTSKLSRGRQRAKRAGGRRLECKVRPHSSYSISFELTRKSATSRELWGIQETSSSHPETLMISLPNLFFRPKSIVDDTFSPPAASASERNLVSCRCTSSRLRNVFAGNKWKLVKRLSLNSKLASYLVPAYSKSFAVTVAIPVGWVFSLPCGSSPRSLSTEIPGLIVLHPPGNESLADAVGSVDGAACRWSIRLPVAAPGQGWS